MTTCRFLLVAVLALAPLAVQAEGFGKPQSSLTVVTVTCSDLRAAARARHPQCQTRPPALQEPALRPVFLADARATAPRRKMLRMPWMVGVYQ